MVATQKALRTVKNKKRYLEGPTLRKSGGKWHRRLSTQAVVFSQVGHVSTGAEDNKEEEEPHSGLRFFKKTVHLNDNS
jgi:hypothetical protein